MKSLYQRAENICSSSEKCKDKNKVKQEQIKMFMSWNGYPSFARNSLIKQLKTLPKIAEKEKGDKKIRSIRLAYLGNIDDSMKKNCF